MGFDLKPNRDDSSWGHFNIWRWRDLIDFLNSFDFDTSELSQFNDGDFISETTCLRIADLLEKNSDTYLGPNRTFHSKKWLSEQIEFFRKCKGCYQH